MKTHIFPITLLFFCLLTLCCRRNTPEIVANDPFEDVDTVGIITSGIRFNFYQTSCVNESFKNRPKDSVFIVDNEFLYQQLFNCNGKILPKIDFSKKILLITKVDLSCYKLASINQRIVQNSSMNFEWQITFSRNEGCNTIPPIIFAYLYDGKIEREKITLSVKQKP